MCIPSSPTCSAGLPLTQHVVRTQVAGQNQQHLLQGAGFPGSGPMNSMGGLPGGMGGGLPPGTGAPNGLNSLEAQAAYQAAYQVRAAALF